MIGEVDGSHGAGARFINVINAFMRDHRDVLGLQLDAKRFPYWMVSNDLVSKFTGFFELCSSRGVDVASVALDVVCAFLATYDDPPHAAGCCSLYHSISKDAFLDAAGIKISTA
jgi:hypothetical protein